MSSWIGGCVVGTLAGVRGRAFAASAEGIVESGEYYCDGIAER